ncbi:hypothetical protein DPMN_106725 [Dreissena polymorpha]|uniref:Uncharacterized protein n=1 Tax=Dreissena polymorpha TaxID=45954 RepID=A0A9D4QK29_DREPO|nr:hypothetical protein DPMN_106725 [Dreissena polymorpha]
MDTFLKRSASEEAAIAKKLKAPKTTEKVTPTAALKLKNGLYCSSVELRYLIL